MNTPIEIPSFVPEAPGLDMINETLPEQRIPAESCAWVRYDDVLTIIMQVRQQAKQSQR